MRVPRSLLLAPLIYALACSASTDPSKAVPPQLLKFRAGTFAYPIGEKEYVTEKNDCWDYWYNAQDFGENRHLGEDWNRTTGGDSDCGEPVFATADGEIVLARNAGPGWGNVVVIEHVASDGTKLRSVYGHLQTIEKLDGRVLRRERIGTISSADGRYKCHLHFEIKWSECALWDEVGPGYADDRRGWIDPSEFIELTR